MDLVTLSEVKAVLGKDPMDTRDDAKLTALIPYVSDAVRTFTERDFGAPTITEARTYEYDGSGFLDIDDASAITEVRMLVPNGTDVVLTPETWTAAPARRDDAPMYSYIRMPILGSWGISPAMGFTYNLDVYAAERGGLWTSNVQVTGTWGWATVPGDIKLAAIWTLQEWSSKAASEGLTAEAIEGYSRSWGGRNAGGTAQALAIPNRARDILAAYSKVDV